MTMKVGVVVKLSKAKDLQKLSTKLQNPGEAMQDSLLSFKVSMGPSVT